jgi:multidrug resistance efflux pump
MMVFLLLSYIAVLVLFVWLRFVPFNLFWKLSPVIVLIGLNLGLFIPMGWGAPSGPAAVVRNSVQIVPSVAGEVADVPIVANTPVKAGDILFRIDPTTYAAQAEAIEAQLKFAELRLSQYSELQRRESGRAFDVQQHESEVDQLRAQLDGAKWNRAPRRARAIVRRGSGEPGAFSVRPHRAEGAADRRPARELRGAQKRRRAGRRQTEILVSERIGARPARPARYG